MIGGWKIEYDNKENASEIVHWLNRSSLDWNVSDVKINTGNKDYYIENPRLITLFE